MNKELLSLIRARNYHHCKYHKSRSPADWERYKALRREVNAKIKEAKAAHYTTVCEDMKVEPRRAWSQLNSVLGRSKNRQLSSLNSKEETVTKTAEIVKMFAKHFNTPPPSCTPTPGKFVHSTEISSRFVFSRVREDDVLWKLMKLDERKACGPDQISARLLKMVAPAVSGIVLRPCLTQVSLLVAFLRK